MIARHLRAMAGRADGSVVAEFAIVAPVMVLLIAGTVEGAHFLMAQVALDSAVAKVARESAVKMNLGEEQRDTLMRERLSAIMRSFPSAAGGELQVATRVYRTLGSSYSEAYEDLDGDGTYDDGEPYRDDNGNGSRDADAPVTGTMGGKGDVVSYSVIYPARPYFALLTPVFGDQIMLRSTTVVRNEPERSVLAP